MTAALSMQLEKFCVTGASLRPACVDPSWPVISCVDGIRSCGSVWRRSTESSRHTPGWRSTESTLTLLVRRRSK